MSLSINKLRLLLGVVVLISGCTALRSKDLQPLRELSAVEASYLDQLAVHLQQQQQNYKDAINDLTSTDLALSRALLTRKRAESLIEVRYRDLVNRGVSKEEAISLAGQERLEQEEQVLRHLAGLHEERANEAKTLNDLYTTLQQGAAAAAENQKQVDAYLKLNWFQRLYVDVNGLDKDGLKNLGDELKMLVERLGFLKGQP